MPFNWEIKGLINFLEPRRYLLQTTNKQLSCVRQAVKSGRIPITVAGSCVLAEWRNSAELACFSVLLKPEPSLIESKVRLNFL